MPRLSVCLPVYNAADTIGRALESVLGQSYDDFECIVIDNQSTDSTLATVEAFTDPRVQVFQNSSNIGFVGNHNECLRRAGGELIQFVHGDDWLLPGCLDSLVPAFDAPNVGLAFGRRHVETTDEAWLERYGELHARLLPLAPVTPGSEIIAKWLALRADGNVIGEPTTVMFRNELLLPIGGFRDQVPQLMDIDAWLRILTRSDVAFIDEQLTGRWHHAGSETDFHQSSGSHAIDRLWVESALAADKNLPTSIRLHAARRWGRDLAVATGTALTAPKKVRGQRVQNVRSYVSRSLQRG